MPATIVLEHTTHPGNIGAVARAMHAMGLENLILISPAPLDEVAYARARGGSTILEQAVITNDLKVLDNFSQILGTTSRKRALHLPVISSRSLTKIENIHAEDTAILFGNETNGLSNELLNRCNMIVEIPAKAGHSLNLSHALQIICYELAIIPEQASEASLTTLAEREAFLAWVEKQYENSNFLKPHTIDRLRTIINKASLDPKELKLLYSLLSQNKSQT